MRSDPAATSKSRLAVRGAYVVIAWLCICLPCLARDAKAQDQAPRLEVVARVRPFEPALLAGTPSGGLWLWQAEAQGPEGGRVRRLASAEAAVLRETDLSPRLVARELGVGDDQPPGAFVGLAADDQRLWFLWRGRVTGRTAVVLGRYDAQQRQIVIEADAQTLADALGVGTSLVLAELDLHRSGQTLWLRVYDLDHSRLFRRSLGGFGLGRVVRLAPADVPVGALAREADMPDLRQETIELAPGPDGGLVVTDRAAHELWTVDPEGQTRWAASIGGLPLGITPAVAGPDGTLLLFAANTARAPGRAGLMGINFPALVVLTPAERGYSVTYHDRDALAVPGGYALYALQLDRLAPAGSGRFYGFHRATGEVVRFSIAAGEPS